MTKIIGLTGGIGSGKSSITHFFSELGTPVYIADDRAKNILNKPEVFQKIQQLFDENISTPEGRPDRGKIAAIVFNQPEKLKALNAIIHPRVDEDFKKWLKDYQNYPYIIKEVAIIFETQTEDQYDQIILVTAPEEERIRRVMLRDLITREQVQERIKNQLPDVLKIKKSHYIIENTDLNYAKNKVEEIHKALNKV